MLVWAQMNACIHSTPKQVRWSGGPQLRFVWLWRNIYGVAWETAHADLMPTSISVQRGRFEKRQCQGWVCTTSPTTIDKGQALFPVLDHERAGHAMERGLDWHRGDESHVADEGGETIAHAPLTSEGLRQWEMHAHVDHVFDMVPFWQRGIDAAEKGEVLRLEEFLDKMEGDGGWRTANEVLGMLGGWKGTSSERGRDDDMGWGRACDWASGDRGAWNWAASQRGGWGASISRAASDATVSSRGRDSGWGATERVRKGRGKAQGVGKRVRVVGAVHGGGRREELRHFVDAIARQEAVTEERRRAMHMFFEMTLEEKIAKIHETIRILRTHAV